MWDTFWTVYIWGGACQETADVQKSKHHELGRVEDKLMHLRVFCFVGSPPPNKDRSSVAIRLVKPALHLPGEKSAGWVGGKEWWVCSRLRSVCSGSPWRRLLFAKHFSLLPPLFLGSFSPSSSLLCLYKIPWAATGGGRQQPHFGAAESRRLGVGELSVGSRAWLDASERGFFPRRETTAGTPTPTSASGIWGKGSCRIWQEGRGGGRRTSNLGYPWKNQGGRPGLLLSGVPTTTRLICQALAGPDPLRISGGFFSAVASPLPLGQKSVPRPC